MSEDHKKNKFEGDTFREVLAETMHAGSLSHAASKLIESFTPDQQERAIKPAKDISAIADKLKLLLSKLSEQEPEDG